MSFKGDRLVAVTVSAMVDLPDTPRSASSLATRSVEVVVGLGVGFYLPLLLLTLIENHVLHRTMLLGLVLFVPFGSAAAVGLRRLPARRFLFLGLLAGSSVGAALALLNAVLTILLGTA